MYVKVFESRDSSRYYIVQYRLSQHVGGEDKFHLMNEKGKSLILNEPELFQLLDTLFREKKNEKV